MYLHSFKNCNSLMEDGSLWQNNRRDEKGEFKEKYRRMAFH